LVEILKEIIHLRKIGCYAEAADYVRMGMQRGPSKWFFKMIWRGVVHKLGGDLPGVRWSPTGDPKYLKALERYRGMGSEYVISCKNSEALKNP
jgi:hypothetical protein